MALKYTFLALTAFILSGCAASGKLYNEVSQSATMSDPAIGRLTIFRTKETVVASGRDTLITVDSAGAKYVSYGGFVSIDTPVGNHELNAAMPGDKTLCKIPVSLKLREELFFEVKPLTGRIFGEAAAAGVSAGFSAAGIYGTDGRAKIDEKNCSGYFLIMPVDREYALKQLATIRESAQ